MIKIQVVINIEIFLFIIIFILTKNIGLYIIFVLFVLVHELGHMLIGILCKLKPKKFMIMPFGFKIVFEEIDDVKNVKTKKLLVAIAGPMVNLCLIIVSILLNLHEYIIYSNLVILLFNIIPIYPLDGGRLLKYSLSIWMDDKKTYRIVNQISNIVIIILTIASSIIILYIQNVAIVFALVYLWYIVIKENRKYRIIKRVYGVIEQNTMNIINN